MLNLYQWFLKNYPWIHTLAEKNWNNSYNDKFIQPEWNAHNGNCPQYSK